MTRIPAAVLSDLSELIAKHMGLYFPESKWDDLHRGIVSSTSDFGFSDPTKCAEWLIASGLDKDRIKILASHLTIGETYFFRDMGVFKVLEEEILPALVAERRSTQRRLKIWSAACSTGEEPLSIAIALKRHIPDLSSWQVTLLGSDINPRSLKKAESRTFSRWSFRNAPPWLIDHYFEKTSEGSYRVHADIRNMVNFFSLNLVEDEYPSLLNSTNAVDVIFCRNVLMYLSPDHAKMVIEKLSHCLIEGGWLFVAPCEYSPLFDQFKVERFEDTIVYRKCSLKTSVHALKTPPATPANPGALPDTVTGAPLAQSFKPIVVPKAKINTGKPKAVKPRPGHHTKIGTEQARPAEQEGSAAAHTPKSHTTSDTAYPKALELYEKGLYREAADALLSATGNNMQTEALFLLAKTFANLGEMDQALKWCEKSIATDKLNPSAHYLQANILQERGATADAIISLTRALYLDPDFVIAHFALGKLSQRAGKKSDAKKHFHNALSCLQSYSREDIVPESGGITAGRLSEIIGSAVSEQKWHE